MRPLIGVTPSLSDNRKQQVVNRDYMEAVRRAGGCPVLLPLTDDMETLSAVLERLDGLLFTGGDDVDPSFYGEEKLAFCEETLPLRDAMEFALCRAALEKDLPMLCICRGEEVLNCVHGGKLYQDVAAQFGTALKHPCYDRPAEKVHTVALEADSRLAAITGLTELGVNSRHHQAVKTVGEGLRAVGHAPDGLTEAVERTDRRFCIGVQWHPETLSAGAPEAQAIFDAFVQACREG